MTVFQVGEVRGGSIDFRWPGISFFSFKLYENRQSAEKQARAKG